MAARPLVVRPKDYAPALNIVGEHVTVLADGEATEGYEIFLQRGPEGSGPPPHSHPWDESFFVCEGQVDFGIGEDAMTASAGTLVHLPAGTVHWFRFGRGGGQMLSMTSRLGASRMFADMAREVAPINPDVEKLAEVGGRHGLKVGGQTTGGAVEHVTAILGFEHVQLAMPAGREPEARAFYSWLLGIPEAPKPPTLAERGGVWFESDAIKIHLGVEADFRPARKAHPALLVRNLRALVNRLRDAGVDVREERVDDYFRVYTSDPFGNRVELTERA